MARYRGPVEKLERRLGVDLGLKGERRLAGKSRKKTIPPRATWSATNKIE